MWYNKIMNMETIITAMITGAFALIGVIITNHASNKKNSIDQALRDQQIQHEIKELSMRVDKHNGMLDKVANIEKTIVRIETKIEDSKNA